MLHNTYSSRSNLIFLNEKKYEQKSTLYYANKLQGKTLNTKKLNTSYFNT